MPTDASSGRLREAGERALLSWFERGFEQLVRYLENHAAFEEYCRRRRPA